MITDCLAAWRRELKHRKIEIKFVKTGSICIISDQASSSDRTRITRIGQMIADCFAAWRSELKHKVIGIKSAITGPIRIISVLSGKLFKKVKSKNSKVKIVEIKSAKTSSTCVIGVLSGKLFK